MNIPSEIIFGGHVVRIRLLSNEDIVSSDYTGSYIDREKLIRLDNSPDLPESVQAETFMHEIDEMIKHTFSLDISHKDLTVMSEARFAIIRNNKLDFTDTRRWVEPK